MDTMTNDSGIGLGMGGIGFLALILIFWFLNKSNETPNGYCQDMSTQCASGIATQTQLNSAIRTEQELCNQNTLILTNNEKTRDKLDNFRDEYQRDQLSQARFSQQKADFENSMLRQQLVTQSQFATTNASIAQLGCQCLKNPPFYPYGCTPCPVSCNGLSA